MNFLTKLKFLADMPRISAISVVIIAGAILAFIVLYPTLGGLNDSVRAKEQFLTGEIKNFDAKLSEARTNQSFVEENTALYESLLNSDRLVPHTRRVAVQQLQKTALERGLTSLNYSFSSIAEQSLAGAAVQPQSGQYRVSSEKIELKVGAPLDTPILEFALDLGESFPGAAVVRTIKLSRVAEISDSMLESVSQGLDTGLVNGELEVTWRTAQANETEKK